MYFRKEIISGKVCEVVKSYTKFEGKNQKREAKNQKTPEQMEEQNYRNAVKKLTRLLNCNFSDGDLWVTLTYKKIKGQLPRKQKD